MSLLPPEPPENPLLAPVEPGAGFSWRRTTPAPTGAQIAFVDEARAAMGQPSVEDFEEHLDEVVTIKLSDGEVVTGVLSAVTPDEPGQPTASVTVDDRVIPVRSIESLNP